jgi:Tfp pilus assembly protein PilV
MRSTERQRGASLVEAVVASALMGIGVVGGLTAWDTASMSAAKAVRIAWANCIVRSEMDAILSAQYSDIYDVPSQFAADGTVEVHVSQSRGAAEQLITVKAYDPTSNHTAVLAHATALKASALAGSEPIDEPLGDVAQGCPNR